MVLLIQQNLESKEANQLCTILYKSRLVILSFHALKAQVKPFFFECINIIYFFREKAFIKYLLLAAY